MSSQSGEAMLRRVAVSDTGDEGENELANGAEDALVESGTGRARGAGLEARRRTLNDVETQSRRAAASDLTSYDDA